MNTETMEFSTTYADFDPKTWNPNMAEFEYFLENEQRDCRPQEKVVETTDQPLSLLLEPLNPVKDPAKDECTQVADDIQWMKDFLDMDEQDIANLPEIDAELVESFGSTNISADFPLPELDTSTDIDFSCPFNLADVQDFQFSGVENMDLGEFKFDDIDFDAVEFGSANLEDFDVADFRFENMNLNDDADFSYSAQSAHPSAFIRPPRFVHHPSRLLPIRSNPFRRAEASAKDTYPVFVGDSSTQAPLQCRKRKYGSVPSSNSHNHGRNLKLKLTSKSDSHSSSSSDADTDADNDRDTTTANNTAKYKSNQELPTTIIKVLDKKGTKYFVQYATDETCGQRRRAEWLSKGQHHRIPERLIHEYYQRAWRDMVADVNRRAGRSGEKLKAIPGRKGKKERRGTVW